jgi:PKD repeat protein
MTRLVALTLTAFAVLVATAGADTFCVSDPDCVTAGGTSEPTIQAAFTAAAAATPPLTVLIGPGIYSGSPTFNSTKQVTIRGAGEGQTTLMMSGQSVSLAIASNNDDVVSDMSIQVSGTATGFQSSGVSLGGGTADHIAVTIGGTGGAGFVVGPGTVTNSTVTALPGTPSTAGVDVEGGPAIVQDSVFTAAIGIGGGSPLIAQRDVINATDKGVTCFGVCAVQDSVISMSSGSSYGLGSECSGTSADASATNVTIVGPAPASAEARCGGASLHASLTIDSSILRGANAHALQAVTTGVGTMATITPTYDDYDPTTDAVSGPGNATIAQPGVGQLNADPMFVNPASGDFRIPGNSPAVDHGNPAPVGFLDSTTDLAGQPRVVNGRRDIGAYEYQRQPPTASINGYVQTVPAGTVDHFDGSKSSDPDPGDTLTYAWRADDGATGTGSTFDHAFTTPGNHTVTLTVTDPAGLTATASATVAITAAPPPKLTGLKESRKRWHRRGGTTFSFHLSQAATVTLVFNHRHHVAGKLIRQGRAGTNTIHFTGRLAHGKRLRPGRYSVSVTATSGGGTSAAHTLRFTIVRS